MQTRCERGERRKGEGERRGKERGGKGEEGGKQKVHPSSGPVPNGPGSEESGERHAPMETVCIGTSKQIRRVMNSYQQ